MREAAEPEIDQLLQCPSGYRGRMRIAHSMMVFVFPMHFQGKNGVGNWSWNGSEAFVRKGGNKTKETNKTSVKTVAWIESVFGAGFGADPSLQRLSSTIPAMDTAPAASREV